MVAQRMGSQRGGCNITGETQSETRIWTQDRSSDPLARQGSLYSLTLDEVQNHLGNLGKPLSSMNLDELLKTVWTAEVSNQAMQDVDYGSGVHQAGQPANGSYLCRQSGVMLPMDLSKKTVDEVWQDIQLGEKRGSLDKKVTLGEMTLEDFLVKAGVVAEAEHIVGKKAIGSVNSEAEPMTLSLQAQWMNCQVPSVYPQPQQRMVPVSVASHPFQQHISYPGNPTMEAETQITVPSTSLMGALSDTRTPERKRIAPGDIAEKSVERRQKRMIKNRESAARSRARKQAYTQELENKISRLEEEVERLKKQKELVKVLPATPLPEPKHRLCRTSSAPF